MEGLDFGPEENNRMQMPKGHEGMDPSGIDKCPFAKMGSKGKTSPAPEASKKQTGKPSDKFGANKQTIEEKDEESEEEAPQGGCPVMTNGRLNS